MKSNEARQELMKLLSIKYETIILDREQAAEALSISTSLLDKRKRQALPPRYLKSGGANSKVQYLVSDIVDYLLNSRIKAI